MRGLFELLKIAKEEFNNVNKGYTSLCNMFVHIYIDEIITTDEYTLLKVFINNYLTKEHKFFYHVDMSGPPKFYKNRLYSTGAYAWKPNLKGSRNRWLDKHIKLNENKS